MTDTEAWYDAEIAPELLRLGKACETRGLSFIAVVEYAPGLRGETSALSKEASLEMVMLRHCARTVPNIDSYVLGLARYAKENGISTDASIVMRALTPNASSTSCEAAPNGDSDE